MSLAVRDSTALPVQAEASLGRELIQAFHQVSRLHTRLVRIFEANKDLSAVRGHRVSSNDYRELDVVASQHHPAFRQAVQRVESAVARVPVGNARNSFIGCLAELYMWCMEERSNVASLERRVSYARQLDQIDEAVTALQNSDSPEAMHRQALNVGALLVEPAWEGDALLREFQTEFRMIRDRAIRVIEALQARGFFRAEVALPSEADPLQVVHNSDAETIASNVH